MSSGRPRAERNRRSSAPRARRGPRVGEVAAQPRPQPPRRAARPAPSRPCRGRGRPPARSRRRRAAGRRPPGSAGPRSRRARTAPGCAARAGSPPRGRRAAGRSRARRGRAGRRRRVRPPSGTSGTCPGPRVARSRLLTAASLRASVDGRELAAAGGLVERAPSSATYAARTRASTPSRERSAAAQPGGELLEVDAVAPARRRRESRAREKPLDRVVRPHGGRVRAPARPSCRGRTGRDGRQVLRLGNRLALQAAAKHRHASSSVAPVFTCTGAPCVLALEHQETSETQH